MQAISRLGLVLALIFSACGDNHQGGPDGGGDGDGDLGAAPDLTGGGGDLGTAPLGAGLATLAGDAQQGDDDGARGQARFNNPVNLAVAPSGEVFVADFDNSLVRVVSPSGESRTVTAPPGFFRPFGLAVAPDGTLYVQTDGDTLGNRSGALWRVDGNGNTTLLADEVGRMRGLTALPDGRLAMAEYQQHFIALFQPGTGELTPLAGAAGQAGYADGAGTEARFAVPYDLAVLPDGALLVTDHENHRLRRVDLSGSVSTWAGSGTPGRADGPRASAELDRPQGLAVAGDGTVFVSDTGGFTIRRIDPAGMVATVAGDGTAGFRDDADPLRAKLFGIEGIDLSSDGALLYIADGNRGEDGPYHRVRRLTLR
jgi:DNA-binding beta-propeller fold protein YncE